MARMVQTLPRPVPRVISNSSSSISNSISISISSSNRMSRKFQDSSAQAATLSTYTLVGSQPLPRISGRGPVTFHVPPVAPPLFPPASLNFKQPKRRAPEDIHHHPSNQQCLLPAGPPTDAQALGMPPVSS